MKLLCAVSLYKFVHLLGRVMMFVSSKNTSKYLPKNSLFLYSFTRLCISQAGTKYQNSKENLRKAQCESISRNTHKQ